MSPQTNPVRDARRRLLSVALGVSLAAVPVVVVAPAAIAEDASDVRVVSGPAGEGAPPASDDAPDEGSSTEQPGEETGAPELPASPAPGESASPEPSPPVSPAPTSPPSPEPTASAPASPQPSPSAPEPAPPVTVPEAPRDPVSGVETPLDPGSAGAPGLTTRFGALQIRWGWRASSGDAGPAATPEAAEPTAAVEGEPDVGGTAELSASMAPEAATGRTDAREVRDLSEDEGSSLTRPVVWAPWAGALGLAGVVVAALFIRGARPIGR